MRGVLNVTSPAINDIICDGTQLPWLRNLTIVTQDEAATASPNAPAPVIDGGSF